MALVVNNKRYITVDSELMATERKRAHYGKTQRITEIGLIFIGGLEKFEPRFSRYSL